MATAPPYPPKNKVARNAHLDFFKQNGILRLFTTQ